MTQKISVIQRFITVSAGCPKPFLKARVHRQFLSQQLNVIFVAPKLQLQNRTWKPAAISDCDFRKFIAE